MKLPAALLAVVFLSIGAAPAADWSQWRGPNQDGRSLDEGVFGPGEFGLEVAWSRPLGIAYSGIAVVGGRAVTMFADGEFDWLTAMDAATGEEIWRYKIDAMFEKIGGSDGGPLSMPIVDDGIVYGLGARGHLFAVRLDDGSEIWSTRIDESLGAQPPRFGFTTTPLVVGKILFVEAGGSEGRALTGFDKKTGKVLWSAVDESVGYQSPLFTEVAGREQVVAVTNKSILGVVPTTGEVLWSHEHGTSPRDGSSSPVALGNDRFLLTGRNESAAFQVTRRDGAYEVEEVWRSTALKQSFATPVLHEGHLYGFDGDFLTCVNPEDGSKVWKSRPPGGRGLILVDDHLVIFAGEGMVVVAEASPEGYREKARAKVSELGSFTYPSFAEQAIFVRNIRDIARVQVSDIVPVVRKASDMAPRNDFERFVRQVETADDKRLLLDHFMGSQERFPIVEDGKWVHFVYRGEADDVAITGSMTEFQLEESLQHIEGTDIFYASYPIEPGARWEYRFNVDFENLQTDPLNPRRVPTDDGYMSELAPPGWSAPDHVRPYAGSDPGRVETFEHESAILGNEREIDIYLPAGYDGSRESYPLLLINDGKDWLDKARLANSLNNLIGSKIRPIIVAFVERLPSARAEFGGDRSADYLKMLTDELVPHLDRTYRTKTDPAARAIMGVSSAALMSAYAAVERPDVFGKAGGYSVYLADPLGKELMGTIEANTKRKKPQLSIMWNRYDLRREEWSFDVAKDSRRLSETLKASGYEVDGGERLDAAGWGSWGVHAAEALERFFPM